MYVHIEQWIHHGLNFVAAHPHLGFMFAFIIAFSESLPIIGTIIPGSVTMTAIGTLIGTGALPLVATLSCSVLGAFSGDLIGYAVGLYYKDNLASIWPFKRYPSLLTKGTDFFAKHGGKSIIIGRFVGPIRSAVPLIAGCLQLKPLKFIIAALPSAILWAIAYITPGIILGALALDIPASQLSTFLIVGVIIIVLMWALLWAIKSSAACIYQAYRKKNPRYLVKS